MKSDVFLFDLLLYRCELRFPSTAIRLKFESLVNSSSEEQPLEQLDCCEVTDDTDAESAQLGESIVMHSSASVVATDEDTNRCYCCDHH